jgi:hypothetical protein
MRGPGARGLIGWADETVKRLLQVAYLQGVGVFCYHGPVEGVVEVCGSAVQTLSVVLKYTGIMAD